MVKTYANPDGRFDELFAGKGVPRAHWSRLYSTLASATADEIGAMRVAAERQIRESGVTYNVYADPKGHDRPWDLDVLPFIIDSHEWQGIEAGIALALMGGIYLVSRGGMGDGDVRLAPLLGLHLGYLNPGIVPIGLFFGRIANFINGELWGRPSNVPWAMVFPEAGPVARHPSQLYEAALEGLALFVLLRFLTHHRLALKSPGMVAGVFLAGYGAARSFCEFFREPDQQHALTFGIVTPGIVYSIPMIILGVWLVMRARANRQVTA